MVRIGVLVSVVCGAVLLAGCAKHETQPNGISEPGLRLFVRSEDDEYLLGKYLALAGERKVMLLLLEGVTPKDDVQGRLQGYCETNGIWLAIVPVNTETGRRIGRLVGVDTVPSIVYVDRMGVRHVLQKRWRLVDDFISLVQDSQDGSTTTLSNTTSGARTGRRED